MTKKKNITKYTSLTSIKKINVFTVPGGYFDELPFIIQTKINKEEDKSALFGLFPLFGETQRGVEFSWVEFFLSKPVKYAVTIASFSLILIIGYHLITLQKTVQDIDYLANITKEEIVDYLISTNVNEFEIMDLAYKSKKTAEELIINDFEVTDAVIEEFTPLDIDYLDYLEFNPIEL